MKKIFPSFLFVCIAFFNSAQAQIQTTEIDTDTAEITFSLEVEITVVPERNPCMCASDYSQPKRRKRFALRSLLSAGTLAVVAVPYVVNKQKEQAKFSDQQSTPAPANSRESEETNKDY
jgi:hypothetical protein